MFRGKAVLTQEYVYGYLCIVRDKKGNKQTQILVPDNFVGYNKMYVVEEDTVEEEMRMYDVNGKSVYEGDRIAVEIGKYGRVAPVQPQKYVGQAVIYKGCACIHIEQKNKDMYIQLYMTRGLEILESHGDEDKWKKVNV